MKDRILAQLPQGHPWRDLVQVHDALDSTNNFAKDLARQGAAEGTVVIARTQSAGRGRLGRSFHSPDGSGLYFSLILRPHCPASELMHLTCAAAIAACDAVELTQGIRPGVKWINDLVLGSKKLGGILTELSFDKDALVDFAVVGIGINCLAPEKGFPEELQGIACSLHGATGRKPDIGSLAAALMVELEKLRRCLLTDRRGIMDRYRRDCVTLGRQVRVIAPAEVYPAQALEVNEDGSLTVLLEDGQRRSVHAGEVSVRGLWDYL